MENRLEERRCNWNKDVIGMKLEYDQVSKEPKQKKINNYWNINVITLHVKCRIRNGDLWKGRRRLQTIHDKYDCLVKLSSGNID
jgi:hypothetical protein